MCSNHRKPARPTSPYRNHRFPSEIIGHAVRLYNRFSLSFRNAEELLAERGVIVSYEAVCQWCFKFGQAYAKKLRHRRGRPGDTWHLDELFIRIRTSVTISGERWIRMARHSIFSYRNGAIHRPRSGSFGSF